MRGYIINIEEVLLLTLKEIGENLETLKETLKSFHIKVKSNGLYLISVMVLAQLFHMLARVMYWTFNRYVSSSKSHKLESLRQSHISYDKQDNWFV